MFSWLLLYPAGFVVSLFVAILSSRRFRQGAVLMVAASISATLAALAIIPDFFANGMYDLGVHLYVIFLVWIMGALGAALGLGLRRMIGDLVKHKPVEKPE